MSSRTVAGRTVAGRTVAAFDCTDGGLAAVRRTAAGLFGAAVMLAGTAAPAADGVERHSATVSAANALIAEVRVSLARAARVYVEYDNPQAGRYRTALSEPGAEHVIPIVRLRPETTYDYTIFVAGDSGQDESEPPPGGEGRFTTGPLPPPLATVPARVTGRSSQPLILADYRRHGVHAFLVFRDETGSVVWYNLEPQTYRTGPIDRLPGGNLVFLNNGRLTEMTPLGEVVNRFERGGQWGKPHHDVTVLDDGRVIFPSREDLVLDDSANGGAAKTLVYFDDLRIWDPANGRVEQVWEAKAAWDVLDPDQRVPGRRQAEDSLNWTHLNSVTISPRGSFILSLRERDQVVSLSPDFRTIEWQLGGPDSDYEFPDPADRFYRQHTASQLANGNVLLFDNGWSRPEAEGGHYSRALELRLDDAAGTAVKAWEYRPDPDVYAPTVGSAYRLRNGNTLVNFPLRERLTDGPLLIVEVDAAGNEVFRLENLPWYAPALRGYRAYGGIAAIMGETMLRRPAAAYRPAHVDTFPDGFTVAVDPARFREIEAAVEGAQPLAAGAPFDLYLVDGRLVYAKDPCAPEDVANRFALHVFPAGADRFDNLDFSFVEHGQRWQGACLAAVTLPDYPIGRIRTGQFITREARSQAEIRGDLGVWSTEFPVGD